MATKKLQILDSLIVQADNADTLDGKHAEEFALASDVQTLQEYVGDTAVSEQISKAFEEAKKSEEFDCVNIRALDAKGDGATDDSAAFNEAIYKANYLSVVTDGEVYTVEGESIEGLTRDKLTVVGTTEDGKTVYSYDDGGSPAYCYADYLYHTIIVPEGVYRVQGLRLRSDIKIEGHNATLKITDDCNVDQYSSAPNCLIVAGDVIYEQSGGSKSLKIDNNTVGVDTIIPIRNVEISGIYFIGNCQHFFDNGSHVYEKFANNGVFIQNAENVTIHHCSFDDIKDRCIGGAVDKYLSIGEDLFVVHGLHVYDCEFLAGKLPIATEKVGTDEEIENGSSVTGGAYRRVEKGTYNQTDVIKKVKDPQVLAGVQTDKENDVYFAYGYCWYDVDEQAYRLVQKHDGSTTITYKETSTIFDDSKYADIVKIEDGITDNGNDVYEYTLYYWYDTYEVVAGYYRVPATTPAIQLNQSGALNCNSDIIIERCTVHKATNMGFMFYYYTKNVTIRDCKIMNCGLYTSEGINTGRKKRRVEKVDNSEYRVVTFNEQYNVYYGNDNASKVTEEMYDITEIEGVFTKVTENSGGGYQVYSYNDNIGNKKYCYAKEQKIDYCARSEIVTIPIGVDVEQLVGETTIYGDDDVYWYQIGDTTYYYAETDTWEYYDEIAKQYVKITAIADIEDEIDYWYFASNTIGDDDGRANHALGGCIKFNSVRNATVENCYLYGARGANISVYSTESDARYPGSNNIAIRNNRIFGNPEQARSDGFGILISDARDVKIVGNVIKDHIGITRTHAIFGADVSRYFNSVGVQCIYKCLISGNTLDNCKYAMSVRQGRVVDNHIVGCNYSIYAASPNDLYISGNNIENGNSSSYNVCNGIQMTDGDDCVIANNFLNGLYCGIESGKNAHNITFCGNIFKGFTNFGIYNYIDDVAHEHDGINIYGNQFVDVSDNSKYIKWIDKTSDDGSGNYSTFTPTNSKIDFATITSSGLVNEVSLVDINKNSIYKVYVSDGKLMMEVTE